MDASMAAGASPMPPMGQQAPTGVGNVQVSPGQAQAVNPSKLEPALKAALGQVLDRNGFVDMNKLVLLWPQIAKQAGLNIPFQTVLQMIQQDPSIIEDLITQMGIAGITVNGKQISAEELLAQSQSSGAATGSPAANGPGGA